MIASFIINGFNIFQHMCVKFQYGCQSVTTESEPWWPSYADRESSILTPSGQVVPTKGMSMELGIQLIVHHSSSTDVGHQGKTSDN